MDNLFEILSVSQSHQKKLEKAELNSVESLSYFFPRQYRVYSNPVITEGKQFVRISGQVVKTQSKQNFCMMTVAIAPQTYVNIFWFHNKYMDRHIYEYKNRTIYACGQAEYNTVYHSFSMTAPEIFGEDPSILKNILPIYKTVLKIDSQTIHRYILKALYNFPLQSEIIPDEARQNYGLVSRKDAFWLIHNPRSAEDVIEAQKYFVIEKLYQYAQQMQQYSKGFSKETTIGIQKSDLTDKIISNLPFSLTGSQSRLVYSFKEQTMKKERIQALVQGDVSCGKTIIAQLAMLMMAENGYQAAMIAPTTILAEQHFNKLQELISDYPELKCVLVTGDLKVSEKKKIHKAIQNNEYNLIIGTTAVLSDSMEFANLGLIVTDEEHRFGVAQKEVLTKKAVEGVHMIQMSATPIPRSLAQVIYTDTMQVETVTDLPPGRLPVVTSIEDRQSVINMIEEQRKLGYKVYIICPQIEAGTSSKMNVEEAVMLYQNCLSNPDKIASVTGRMKIQEAQERIKEFRDGKYDVLISTTVVEVGVDVPDAALIVLEDANMFGISQLHQLRGRVGRSNIQSYCMLLPSENITEDGQKRLDTLCKTNNGLEIAQADMAMRGTGEITGTQQSGDDDNLMLALKYPETFKWLRNLVKEKTT